jgi:hypothetical protein
MDLVSRIFEYLWRHFTDLLSTLPLSAILTVLVIGIAAIITVYIIDFSVKMKRNDIGDFLRQAGFKPVKHGLNSLLIHLEGFRALYPKDNPVVLWAAEANKNGVEWLIIEFKSSPLKMGDFFQTVILAKLSDKNFPSVFIGPRFFFAIHNEFANYLDISSREYQKFFSVYTVKTTEPELLRKVFIKPDIMDGWEKNIARNRVVEVKTDTILIYNCEKSASMDPQGRLRQFQEAEFAVQTLSNILSPQQ